MYGQIRDERRHLRGMIRGKGNFLKSTKSQVRRKYKLSGGHRQFVLRTSSQFHMRGEISKFTIFRLCMVWRSFSKKWQTLETMEGATPNIFAPFFYPISTKNTFYET